MKVKAEDLCGCGLEWAVSRIAAKRPGDPYYGRDLLWEQGVSIEYDMNVPGQVIARFEDSELTGWKWTVTGLRLLVKVKLGEILDLPDEVLFYHRPPSRELPHSVIDKLFALAEMLTYEVPPEKLNMGSWESTSECGFAGCAAGWAATMPEFNNQGFHLSDRSPKFMGFTGWEAIEEFFEIGEEESKYLFDPESYPVENITPVMVADRIRSLLDQDLI